MLKRSKNLYIAVESIHRELAAKLLLGCFAWRDGYRVVVGNSIEMRSAVRSWPPGIILWKGLAPKNANLFSFYRRLGHRVVSWCEEGLTYPDRDLYARQRLSGETLKFVDTFFAWGPRQIEDIARTGSDAMDRVRAVGNPRLDLLRPEFRSIYGASVDEIRREFGRMILVNTNFAAYTRIGGPDAVMNRMRKTGKMVTAEEEAYYKGRSENRKRVFDAFVEAIRVLSESFSEHTILVRPHPSEHSKLWQSSVGDIPRVVVRRDGAIVPWILASEVMVHNDCTTGLEGYLLDVPVVSYRPTAGNIYESELPLAVSHKTESIEELVRVTAGLLPGAGAVDVTHHGIDQQLIDYYLAFDREQSSTDMVLEALARTRDGTTSPLESARALYRRLKFRLGASRENRKKAGGRDKYAVAFQRDLDAMLGNLASCESVKAVPRARLFEGSRMCHELY